MVKDYKALLQNNAKMPDVVIIQNDIIAANNWVEAYWIGKYIFEQASGKADRLIIDAYEKAFSLGLNIRVNRECFLTAAQQLAKIYFQFRKYDEAINMLMVLDSNTDQLPDWVNLYYASAQIHTENVLLLAEIPELFFKRIDGIDENAVESVRRRKFLFLEFLNRLSEISRTKKLLNVNEEAIISKAVALGVTETREFLNFKIAIGIFNELTQLPDGSLNGDGQKPSINVLVYEEMFSELRMKLADLQDIIDTLNISLKQKESAAEDNRKLISRLQLEKDALKSEYAKQAEELKSAKEYGYALQAKSAALESQLSGSESVRKQMEQDASIIGELKADVEDLKTALNVTRKSNDSLRSEIAQNQEIINALRSDLLQSQKKEQALQATITNQSTQLEIAQAAVRTAEASARDAEERAKAVATEQNLDNNEGKFSQGSQPTYPEVLSLGDFLPRRQSILVIGGAIVKETHLRGKLKSMGFKFDKDQLEFELEYDNVKAYASRIKPFGGKYAGIIVGPCPHKTKDTDGYSSFIQKIKVEEGYPHVEEARDSKGELKISNTSFAEAMLRMSVYLQSTN